MDEVTTPDTTVAPAAGGATAAPATAAEIAPGIVPEDEMAEVSECWALARRVVTKVALKRLGIRLLGEEEIAGTPVYLVSREGYDRLRDAGYRFSNTRTTHLEGINMADVVKPADGFVAPATVTAAAPVAAAGAAAPTVVTAAAPATGFPKKKVEDCAITFKTWDGVVSDAFKNKVKELIKQHIVSVVERDVDLYVPHARAVQAKPDGNFNIFVWSSPTLGGEDARFPVPETMWGHPIDPRDPGCFLAWDVGTAIVSSEGDEVGAFDKNNLFLYWDAVHADKEATLKLLTKFFTEAGKAIKNGAKPPSLADMKERYVALCSKRHAAQVKVAEDEFRKYEQEIPKIQKQLIEAIRQCEKANHFFMNAKTHGGAADKHFGEEFDAMRRMDKILNVFFRGDCLMVETDLLYFVDPRTSKTHELGKMRLSINTVSGVARMHNLTCTMGAHQAGMQAPHVFPDGKGCLGSIDRMLPELIGQYEYAAAVQVMISYLESVNVDDAAGKHCDKWPVVDAAKVAKESDERAAARAEAFKAEMGGSDTVTAAAKAEKK